MNLLWTYY